MKDARKGLKPKQRKLATTGKGKLTGNQWQNTPQQNKFMTAWLDPKSPTFGNAYRSALEAGYNERYAAQIASPPINNKWIQEYRRLSKLEVEHLEQKLISMINGEITRNESNSPEDTRIRAMELLGKFTGKLNDKGNTTNILVQPILSGTSVAKVVEPKEQ